MFDIPQLAFVDNPIVWVIVGLALLCYVQQFNLLLGERDAKWKQQVGIWLKVLPVLLSALPLLGLLGTIVGLMATFRSMGLVGVPTSQNFLSSGIADALITTQLGLVSVIPGLLLLAVLRYRHRTLAL
jgi:biopolymer transport protein ExbB